MQWVNLDAASIVQSFGLSDGPALTCCLILALRYLEEAIMNLDSSHPVTREHMRSVLQGFQRNMNMYLMTHPNNKKVKMLLMAVNHLVTS